MGYGRTIKESDLERLRPLFKALETLPEGKGITYTDHPLQISKDRTIIYTYWDIHNLKGIFKLMNPRPEEIKIIRPVTFTPAVDLADRLSEFTAPHTKAKRAFPGFQGSNSSRAQETQPQPKDFKDLLKKKYGKEPAEEGAGSGIEFYAQHGADKTFAEFHPLVMASQEAGELSELETSRAFDEHQRVHGMPSEGGDNK